MTNWKKKRHSNIRTTSSKPNFRLYSQIYSIYLITARVHKVFFYNSFYFFSLQYSMKRCKVLLCVDEDDYRRIYISNQVSVVPVLSCFFLNYFFFIILYVEMHAKCAGCVGRSLDHTRSQIRLAELNLFIRTYNFICQYYHIIMYIAHNFFFRFFFPFFETCFFYYNVHTLRDPKKYGLFALIFVISPLEIRVLLFLP